MIRDCNFYSDDKGCRILDLLDTESGKCNKKCKFYKTTEQFYADIAAADKALADKGLKACRGVDSGGNNIVTVMPVKVNKVKS